MRYPLTPHEGHLLITVDGRRYLLDTGSPWSLGCGAVHLAGREFALQATDLEGQSWGSVAELVGTPLDGLIGMDILVEFDLEIAMQALSFTVSPTLLNLSGGLPLQSLQGVPLLECEIAGRPANLVLDTGAPLSYVGDEYTVGASALGEVADFHPRVGRFRVPTFSVPVRVGTCAMTLRAGSLPTLLQSALELAGADGILGTEALAHGVVRLSSRQGLLRLEGHA